MQLDILSADLLGEILLFLPIENLPSVLLANRYLREIADSETQWHLVYFIVRPAVTPPKKENVPPVSGTGHETNRDVMFPHETWKYNVQMTRNHRWSPYFIDSEGNKITNSMGPIIDESGKELRFTKNVKERRYRIANTARPINTRGKTGVDLKVQMCLEDGSGDSSFCSSWVLLGIIDESILRDLYTSEKDKYVYLGEFEQGENIGYANNGCFSRVKKIDWTDEFCPGDLITYIVDAEYEYEAAKESNWEKPYGLLTCLLNGIEAEIRSYTGILANPDARLYFCTQVDEDCREIVITTIQPFSGLLNRIEQLSVE